MDTRTMIVKRYNKSGKGIDTSCVLGGDKDIIVFDDCAYLQRIYEAKNGWESEKELIKFDKCGIKGLYLLYLVYIKK